MCVFRQMKTHNQQYIQYEDKKHVDSSGIELHRNRILAFLSSKILFLEIHELSVEGVEETVTRSGVMWFEKVKHYLPWFWFVSPLFLPVHFFPDLQFGFPVRCTACFVCSRWTMLFI